MLLTVSLALLVLAVHEAGHLAARSYCDRHSFTPAEARVVRLEAMAGAVDRDGPWRPDTFTKLSAARTTAADGVRVALAGPLTSLLAGGAAVLVDHDVALVGGLTSLVFGLVTLLPVPGSDGRRAIRAHAILRDLRRR